MIDTIQQPQYRPSSIRQMQRSGEMIEVDILWDTPGSIREKVKAGWRFVRGDR